MTREEVDDEMRAIAAYERRYRFFWLFAAWVMMALQSGQMFMVMANTAVSRETAMTPIVLSSMTFIVVMAILAWVYKFILYPDSSTRWWTAPFIKQLVHAANEAKESERERQAA